MAARRRGRGGVASVSSQKSIKLGARLRRGCALGCEGDAPERAGGIVLAIRRGRPLTVGAFSGWDALLQLAALAKEAPDRRFGHCVSTVPAGQRSHVVVIEVQVPPPVLA